MDADQWFHGDAALFDSLQYAVNDRLTLAMEYSSDAYEAEFGAMGFEQNLPVNIITPVNAAALIWATARRSRKRRPHVAGALPFRRHGTAGPSRAGLVASVERKGGASCISRASCLAH